MEATSKELSEITALCRLQVQRQLAVEEAELGLKKAKELLRQVQEVDLPLALAQAGVSEIRLPTGEKVTVKEDVDVCIPKEDIQRAHTWLRQHGFADIIKNTVTVSFGKGEEEQARALLAECTVHGWHDVARKESVHHSTLKAFVREQLAKGHEIPMELFGAWPTSKAVIK